MGMDLPMTPFGFQDALGDRIVAALITCLLAKLGEGHLVKVVISGAEDLRFLFAVGTAGNNIIRTTAHGTLNATLGIYNQHAPVQELACLAEYAFWFFRCRHNRFL